ncbi:MAG TPA: multicopper oxidase domain-containing protein [Jatrophihabitans sp.]|jgi:hypothetical protein
MTTSISTGSTAARRFGRLTLAAFISSAAVAAFVTPAAAAPTHTTSGPAGSARQLSHPSTVTAVHSSAHAAAIGKLGTSGCIRGAGTAGCELYARSGVAPVLGSPIPVWSFATTGSDPLLPVGPTLVVQQGDAVSITVHNQIAGQNVSLALPGQAASDFAGSAADDTVGAATGFTKTYSFTARRAGTFLYEAGHTSNGNRQVAMGLAGALVVLPPDGTAYGSTATRYDDDAVLVLSELDPALNANPTGFDLRNFAPKYRLINGKPYPAADPIATDQGHTVLLRYVNAGAQMHAMSVLGGSQTEIAQDGHAMAYPTTVTSQSIEAGQTFDALVTMPSGPESKIAVYEPAQHLDNNGQTTNDPLQFAFGGMLTFLDTNAAAPTTDSVGPVSSHITLSPNPSDGLADVTVTADLSDANTGGSAVTQAEFVVDDAVTTGAGFGVPMSATFGTVNVTGAQGTIPATAITACTASPPPVSLNCLAAGKHTVFVRALDAQGNWGVIGTAIFNLPKTGPQTTNGSIQDVPTNGAADVSVSATGDDSDAGGNITAAEYFLDNVGANGTGLVMARNRTATVVSETATITAATLRTLTEGTHHVFVHSKDSLGLWGPVLDVPLPVDLTGPTVDAAAVGPNPTNAILSDQGNTGYLKVSAQITDRDAGGAVQSTLIDAEGFLDPTGTPAGGTGFQLIAVDGKLNSSLEAVYGLIPLSQVKALADGSHHVYVRGEDAAGNWGSLFGVELKVDKTAPVLGALTVSPSPTNGAATVALSAPVVDASTIAMAEFWVGTVDPGAGHGSSLPVSVVNGSVAVTVPMAAVPAGTQQFNLRVQDLAGNWSKPVNRSVVVTRPAAIFSDTFESGTLALWSATTGGVANTSAAAMPGFEPGSAHGLQASLPGGTTNQAAYLTDNSPASETGYHARFAFNANTLTSGNNANTAVTIFEGRTTANGQVFAVQYRLNGTIRQLRTVLYRSAGGALTGAWVTLGTGPHLLQVDWQAGPATGATAGSIRLSIDGTNRQQQSGNTNAMRVDTVLLGVTGGFSNTSAGTAYFDNFVSSRNPLP